MQGIKESEHVKDKEDKEDKEERLMSLLFKPSGFNKNEFLSWIDITYESKTKTKLWKRAITGNNTAVMWKAKNWLQNLFMEKYEQMMIDKGADWTAIKWPCSESQLNYWKHLKRLTDKKTDRNNKLKMLYSGINEIIDGRIKNDWNVLKIEDIEDIEDRSFKLENSN